jgi:hypothetical protein
MITGVPFEKPFRASLDEIRTKREKSQQFHHSRTISPVSHQFPTRDLDEADAGERERARATLVDFHLSKMPANERRARTGALNIIDGRCTDETVANAVNDFPNSQIGRSIKALDRQARIVDDREQVRTKELSRVSCRYNNGRVRELRDWNIINGGQWNETLGDDVQNRPSVWEWCSTERLETTDP